MDVVVNHTGDIVLLTGGEHVHRHPVPRLPRQVLPRRPLRHGEAVPVPRRRGTCRTSPSSLPAEPAREEAGLAERPAQLPRPRRHRLRLVQPGVLRAGRLLRPRRPLHREAERRGAASARSSRAGSRATSSTASGSTPRATSTPRSSGSGCRRSSPRPARPACPTSRSSARSFDTDAVDLVAVRARPRPAERARLPVPGRGGRLRVGRLERDGDRRSGSRTTTTSACRTGATPAPPTFLGNHDMGRAAQQISPARRGRRPATRCSSATLLGYDLLYLLRGAPVVYYGDEVGMIGSRRRQGRARRTCSRRRSPDWKTEARVGSPPIGNGSSFDVIGNPIAGAGCETLGGAARPAIPALATGATIVRVREGHGARRQPDRRGDEAPSSSSRSTTATARPASPSPTGPPGATWSVAVRRRRPRPPASGEPGADDPAAARRSSHAPATADCPSRRRRRRR